MCLLNNKPSKCIFIYIFFLSPWRTTVLLPFLWVFSHCYSDWMKFLFVVLLISFSFCAFFYTCGWIAVGRSDLYSKMRKFSRTQREEKSGILIKIRTFFTIFYKFLEIFTKIFQNSRFLMILFFALHVALT